MLKENLNKDISNENKTFQSEECNTCLQNKPNVLFGNCAHISICTTCFELMGEENKNKCIICKKENQII